MSGYKLARLLERAAPKPERFTADERAALVDLASLLLGDDGLTGSVAALALVKMCAANQRRDFADNGPVERWHLN